MKRPNYWIFEGVFGLLELIELNQKVRFDEYDVDDPVDVAKLVEETIRPAVEQAPASIQASLRWSIEYYAVTGSAPLSRIRGGAQELSLPDPESWQAFLAQLGRVLYGEAFLDSFVEEEYVETLDDRPSRTPLQ